MTREPQITQIAIQASTTFCNYHHTVVIAGAKLAAYEGAEDTPNTPGTYFLRSAGAMQRFLKDAHAEGAKVVPCGAKWSYSQMLGTEGFLVDTDNVDRIVEVLPGDIENGGANPGLFLAGSGATIIKLNEAIEPKGWSLRSSGSHSGPSLTGACATGTHGSVLDFGGTQNHVRGLHLVTGPGTSVWLEPEAAPHLAPAFVRRLDPSIVIHRSDALFEAALVHLGGLGFVNAVLLQATPLFDMEVVSQIRSIDQRWLELISSGDFEEVARSFATPGQLYYYELELDPFSPYVDALHSCRFIDISPPLVKDFTSTAVKTRLDIESDDELTCPPRPEADLFQAYKALQFETWPKAPDQPMPRRKIGTWGQLLPKHQRLIPLYSFAFAIDRKDVAKVVPLICEAVKGQKHYFIFALRFVTEAAGTMAFTRFVNSCVINLDGIATSCDPEGNAEQGALLIRAALDSAGIDYSIHWAKLGGLDAAKVSKDFGDPATLGTNANAWVVARKQLLSPEMQELFQHDALRNWGLV